MKVAFEPRCRTEEKKQKRQADQNQANRFFGLGGHFHFGGEQSDIVPRQKFKRAFDQLLLFYPPEN